MESWNADTWAKVAAHAAVVAKHLKELESATSQSFQAERRLDPDNRMSLEGLISAAPSNMRSCFENSFVNIPEIVNPSCRVGRASSTHAVLAPDAPQNKTAAHTRQISNDRIDKLRQYDRVKKREQRDKHCELVRKVNVLRCQCCFGLWLLSPSSC